MNFTATHFAQPPLVLSGSSGLTIQSGMIVVSHPTPEGDDWDRGQVVVDVFTLPALARVAIVQATATAAPAVFEYQPAGFDLSKAGLQAVGDFPVDGFAYGGGDQAPVRAYGHAELTVISRTGGAVVAFPRAGWALDRTRTTHDLNVIRLALDLAVCGPSNLIRLAYTVFAVTVPLDSTHATQQTFPSPNNP